MPHPPTRRLTSDHHEEAGSVDLDAEGRAFIAVAAAAIEGRPVVRLSLWGRVPRANNGPLADCPGHQRLDIPLAAACEIIALLGEATDRARERWGASAGGG